MLALTMWAPALISGGLGEERFREMWAISGVSAMSASALWKLLTGSSVPTLGASGCVCGVLAAWGVLFPETEFTLLDVPLTARELVLLYAAVDALIGIASRGRIDLAAHFGGAAGAASYASRVRGEVENERRVRERWRIFASGTATQGADETNVVRATWRKLTGRDAE